MALHTRESLMKLTGVTRSYIKTYINRKKLVPKTVDGVEYFDDLDKVNADFIRKRVNGKSIPSNSKPKPKQREQSKPEVKVVEFEDDDEIVLVPDPEFDDQPYMDQGHPEVQMEMRIMNKLDVKKKNLEVKKLEEETEIKRLQKEKQMGLVIPTDVVIQLFSTTFKAMTNKFYVAADDILNIAVARLGGSREDTIQMRGDLMEAINTAVKEGQAESLSKIDSIVKEYSDKRGKGERKT